MILEINKKYRNLDIELDDKIIVSSLKKLKFDLKKVAVQELQTKPKGLWYGCEESWMDFLESDMPDWQYDNVYKLELKPSSKLLKITNRLDFDDFEREYSATEEDYQKKFNNKDINYWHQLFRDKMYIDWIKVSK